MLRYLSLPIVPALALLAAPDPVLAQSAAALAGTVSSQEEGAMEGVLVSAKKEGSTITITVVSDGTGHFSFPAAKLDSGRYAISIRAVGYDLQGPRSVDVTAGGPASADLKLVKTKQLPRQLSNGEWITSVPGNEQQKLSLLNCVSCHTIERIVRSVHTKEEFQNGILPRMAGYANQSMPIHPQRRLATRVLE